MIVLTVSLLLVVGLSNVYGAPKNCNIWIATDCNNTPTKRIPVCGSDGRTYYNECFLYKDACIRNTNVRTAYYSNCGHPITLTTPTTVSTTTSFRPVVTTTDYCGFIMKSNCANFPDHNEVCGTNGITYKNRCYLDQAFCVHGYPHVAHDGQCVHHTTTTPTPKMPQTTVTLFPPAVTSADYCDIMINVNCTEYPDQTEVLFPPAVTSADYCDNMINMNCTEYPDQTEVCATNGITYRNRCTLAKVFCFFGSPRAVHNGRCAPPSTTPFLVNVESIALDIFCIDLAYVDCGNAGPRVCATDGHFYKNRCEFDKQRCFHRAIHSGGRNCS